MSYPATIVANYFLVKAKNESRALTALQLVKLVYIAHGWYLGYMDKPLINGNIAAAEYGPNIEMLYKRVRKYGKNGVNELLTSISILTWHKLDTNARELLDSVWSAYSTFSGLQLSTMCHGKDSPWHAARYDIKQKYPRYPIVPNDLIRDYYKKKIEEIEAKKV